MGQSPWQKTFHIYIQESYKRRWEELRVLFEAVREIVHNAVTAFLNDDVDLAYTVEPLEEMVDTLCDEMKLHHVDRLQMGVCKLDQGFVFNDLLTNFERVGDHCSNLAIAVIELASASFDAHQYLLTLREHRGEEFDRMFEEYTRKYALAEGTEG